MDKRGYWDQEKKEYNYKETPCDKFYTKDDLLEVQYCFKDLNRNEKYFISPNKMINNKGEVVFKPKYSGDYPSIIKQFKNLEKIADE